MDSESVKAAAKEFGADLIGIAPVERLAGLPPEHRPERLLGSARSVVVIGHRILRGALRGTEEGTNRYSTYATFGMNWCENRFLARSVYLLTCRLEDSGFAATPVLPHRGTAEACAPAMNAAATAAGLGSVGKAGFFLTPEFGPRQRLAMIVTDAELEPDPVRQVGFCDGCRACLQACPLHAIHENGEAAAFRIDARYCAICRNGTYAADEAGVGGDFDRFSASCGRACLVATEGRISRQFNRPFRTRKVWSIDANGGRHLD